MTITTLTIRQFLKSKSLVVAAIICLIPVAIAIIPHLINSQPSLTSLQRYMGNTIFLNMYTLLLLPISVMVFASAAIGDEIEDKTLYLLALKPVSRLRIIVEKLLAVVLVAVPILWISTMIVWAVTSWKNYDEMTNMIWPMLASELVGVLGFGSIFLTLSMYIRRTFLVGMFYVAIWEGALSGFLPGIRNFSISHYSRSMFVNLLDERGIQIDNPADTTQIIVTIAIIVAVAILLGTWRLRTMAID